MSGPSKDSASPNETSSSEEGQQNRRLKVTLLSSEWRSSTDREVSTISRTLAIHLAKHPNVNVSVFLPKCSEEDKRNAASHNIQLVEADELPGYEPILWLSSLPRNYDVDCVIGHGVHLGRQISLIKRSKECRWIQVVHSVHEEVGMYKNISEGEELQQTEIKLCKMADEVVAIGPKVAEAYKRFLCSGREEETILDLTPGIFSEFLNVVQATDERRTFSVLVIGSGDSCEDFNVKGFNMAAEAIAELKDDPYQLKFLFSPREDGKEIADKLLQHGISRNQLIVRSFNSNREVLGNLFYEVDLAIMPSRTEGFGLCGLEALSAGLPVLISGNSGLGGALKKVLFGSHYVVDSENPKDWAKKIRDVRQKPRKDRLSEAKLLREHYAKAYDWEKPCTVLVEKMQTLAFGSSGSRLAKPVRDKRPTSVADTSQACKRPRGELTDGMYHKGSLGSRFAKPFRDKRLTSVADTSQACKRPREELTDNMYHEGREIPPFQESGQTQGDSTANDRGLLIFTRLLTKEYNRRALLKPLPWQNTLRLRLDDVFTRLSIVSRRVTDFKLEDNEVNMFDIFNTLNKGDDAMVLVEGSPGIGKTTFCLKISHDWANKKIPDETTFPVFKLLLLLKCRDIRGNICEAIFDQLFPKDIKKKAKKRLINYIEDIHNQPSILIVLDGLDELPETAESHVNELLDRQRWSLCYILATSRQEKGIFLRQNSNFSVLLQINGFTEADAFQYIRKHFDRVDEQKGESLIQAIQGNTFLRALPSNPLNLLLLCVVFEDYEGNLPSSRTELYHIIVGCLLRRYRAKNNEKAAADDKAPEEQFKDSLLALGQLAWGCLQEDRFSFREKELAEFESKIKTLAARKLGLVFKEASAKKINPQHEYHFFHKTFQEYLAALYLAHKLLEEKVNVFHDLKLSFDDITIKYKEVFIFVSGILGEATCNLVGQIGENLKINCWNWLGCTVQEATFFTECFSESGDAEQMVLTLCSFIPFPQSVACRMTNNIFEGVLKVANACKNFSQLQLPVNLSVSEFDILMWRSSVVEKFLASYSRLETISFSDIESCRISGLIYNALQVNSSLRSFTLHTIKCFSSEEATAIGDTLAPNKTIQTVTLKLLGELGEDWATVLEKRLSGDTPLTSVVLEINGSVRESGMVAFNKLFLNRSLQSFGLAIYGDMHDSWATLVAKGLKAAPYLKSLTVTVYGSVSCSAFISLKKGILENSALRSLVLKVFGGLPENWLNICEALYAAKKSSLSLTFEPDVVSKITSSQVVCLRPVLREETLGVLKLHSLIVNMWGELSDDGASDLCKLLIASRVSCVNLNIYGRVTDDVATCLVENFDKVKSQFDLSVNIRGRALKCDKNFLYTWNVHDVKTVDGEVELSVVDSLSLSSALTNVEAICSRVSKVSMNFDGPTYSSEEDWGCSLGDFLAKFVSLATLRFSLNNCGGMSEGWMGGLWSGVSQNTSITTLSITFNNNSEISEYCISELGSGLAQSTSITTLSIAVNNYSDMVQHWMYELVRGLAQNASIITLSITVNNYSEISEYCIYERGSGWAQNTSITTLSITVNNYHELGENWIGVLGSGLAENRSITTLSITVNNYREMSVLFLNELGRGVAQNTSITTLSVTLNNCRMVNEFDFDVLESDFVENISITTLSVTINFYGSNHCGWIDQMGSGFAQNTSITTLSIIVNNHSTRSGDWMGALGSGLAQNTSITTLSITVNNYRFMSEDWIGELGSGLAQNTSITTLSITVNNYSDMSEGWMGRLCRGLAQNTSLTTLSITVSIHSDMGGEWMSDLRSVVAQNRSLAILNLTLNNHTNSFEDWINKLCQALSKNTSSIKISLKVNLFSESNEKP